MKDKKNRKLIICSIIILLILFIFIPKKDKEEVKKEIGGPKVTLIEEKETKEKAKKKEYPNVEKKNPITIQESKDANVEKAWKNSEWKTIKTTQTGTHYANFDDNSIDRKEIKLAFSEALDLAPENIEEWWLDGPNSSNIYGFLSNKKTNEAYKVHLHWIDNTGWQPSLVEKLHTLPTSFN